jgi:hypothetical protein
MTLKAPADYSNSSEITNPVEVETLVTQLENLESKYNDLDSRLQAYPEYNESQAVAKEVSRIKAEIKTAIDKYGNFQDLARRLYGLKQTRISQQYHVFPIEAHYPQFAPAVIVKSVNTDAVKGLIKGGLLSEADLKSIQAITETENFAYIIGKK